MEKVRLAQFVKAAVLLILIGSDGPAHGVIKLVDVTGDSGVAFVHSHGGSGKRYIVETATAGVCLFDYDNDGDVDIYFLNGSVIDGSKVSERLVNRLYRNDGNWKFADVTEESGLGDAGYGMGVAAGDYDNDGDLDVYISNYGYNVLYRNNGDGTFSDVTKEAGVANDKLVGAGANFLDMDGDGDLDLYVANYFYFSPELHIERTRNGHPVYVGPRLYKPAPDALYRNDGDGKFTDLTEESGIGGHVKWGMGTVCGDFDGDGDTDIFVANDVSENFLFENDGSGKFEEIALMAGVAYDRHGDEMGSMGTACGDYNNDGLLDILVTSYQGQTTALYKNLGDDFYDDVTAITGAGQGTYSAVTWGCGFVDFENDGDRDIFIAAGHLMDNVELFDDTTTYKQKNVLLMNTGDGKFRDVSADSGDGMAALYSSRGCGFDDLDNDGDVDVVVLNWQDKATILRNDTEPKGHWIEVVLRGTRTNRDGVGARVTVAAGGLTLIDEVHSGHGYQSHYGMRLHFGLGEQEKVERIEVRWLGGKTETFADVKVDSIVTLVEGKGK